MATEWNTTKSTSNVLVATRWTDGSGRTLVRLLAADLPEANEITLDEDGALTWIKAWLKARPARA